MVVSLSLSDQGFSAVTSADARPRLDATAVMLLECWIGGGSPFTCLAPSNGHGVIKGGFCHKGAPKHCPGVSLGAIRPEGVLK